MCIRVWVCNSRRRITLWALRLWSGKSKHARRSGTHRRWQCTRRKTQSNVTTFVRMCARRLHCRRVECPMGFKISHPVGVGVTQATIPNRRRCGFYPLGHPRTIFHVRRHGGIFLFVRPATTTGSSRISELRRNGHVVVDSLAMRCGPSNVAGRLGCAVHIA